MGGLLTPATPKALQGRYARRPYPLDTRRRVNASGNKASMNQGEFNKRVQADAKGDLAIMKDGVNQAIKTLDFMTEELLHLANA
ncbi:MAG: hypothetical protein ACP5Q0_03560, partial [Halothiobacillus sp.]